MAKGGSVRAIHGRAVLLSLAEPLMAALLLLYLLYQFLLSHVEGDQAYLLYAAQQVLNGVQLDGPRLVETNPPLIVWCSATPVALARWLHMDVVLSLRLVVSLMLAGSAAWGWRVLRVARVAATMGRRETRTLWAATFLMITLTQPAEFGQREQLLLILLVPYLLAVGTDAVDRLGVAERGALGVCAGLAVCFKPQHLLTMVCLQTFLLVYRRSWRWLLSVEMTAAAAAGVLYVAAVWLFTPAYLFEIVPLLRSTYWALGEHSIRAMALRVSPGLTACLLGLAIAWYLLRKRLQYAQLHGVLLASAVGAALAYYLQHTGWYHQRFTAIALLETCVVWMGFDLLHGSEQQVRSSVFATTGTRRRTAWMVLPLCAFLLFSVVYARKHRAKPTVPDLTSELASLPPGTTVYAFSVGMNAFPTVVEKHLLWGSRFAHLWMLPAIRANEVRDPHEARPFRQLSHERLIELSTLQRRETTDDLQRTQPAVIFVERCAEHPCEGYTQPFDAVQWFSQDPAFARLWREYRLERQLADFDVYRRR